MSVQAVKKSIDAALVLQPGESGVIISDAEAMVIAGATGNRVGPREAGAVEELLNLTGPHTTHRGVTLSLEATMMFNRILSNRKSEVTSARFTTFLFAGVFGIIGGLAGRGIGSALGVGVGVMLGYWRQNHFDAIADAE